MSASADGGGSFSAAQIEDILRRERLLRREAWLATDRASGNGDRRRHGMYSYWMSVYIDLCWAQAWTYRGSERPRVERLWERNRRYLEWIASWLAQYLMAVPDLGWLSDAERRMVRHLATFYPRWIDRARLRELDWDPQTEAAARLSRMQNEPNREPDAGIDRS